MLLWYWNNQIIDFLKIFNFNSIEWNVAPIYDEIKIKNLYFTRCMDDTQIWKNCKMSSIILNDNQYTVEFKKLITLFDAINDIYCFLRNLSIVPTLKSLESVFLSFNSIQSSNFSSDSLFLLQQLDPDFLKIENQEVDTKNEGNFRFQTSFATIAITKSLQL